MTELDDSPSLPPSLRTAGDSWAITELVGATALGVAAGRAVETGGPDPLIRDEFALILVSSAGPAGLDGRSVTKRLSGRKPSGWESKSAVAIPGDSASGRLVLSLMAVSGWRRPQKKAASGGSPMYSMARRRRTVAAELRRRALRPDWTPAPTG